jgi:hypothetical protein
MNQRDTDSFSGCLATWLKILQHDSLRILLAIFLLDFLWNGYATTFNDTDLFLQMARQPFLQLGRCNYHQENPFFFHLAHILHATTRPRYYLLCVSLMLLAYLALWRRASFHWGKESGTLALLLFIAQPINYILRTWLGMVDGLTVLGTVFILLPGPAWLTLAVSAVLTFNHPTAWFFAPALLALRFLANARTGLMRQALAVFAGLLAGSVMAKGVAVAAGIAPYYRWHAMLDTYWLYFPTINLPQLPLAFYSFYFALWLPVIAMLLVLYRRNPALAKGYLVCMGLFYGVTFFCDTTRTFALLSWAPTLYVLLYTWQATRDDATAAGLVFRLSVVAVACFGWLAPHLFVLNGQVYAPGFAHLQEVAVWLFTQLGSK